MPQDSSDDDSKTELEASTPTKARIEDNNGHRDEDSMENSDEEDNQDEGVGGGVHLGGRDVIVGESETASAVTFKQYYSEAHARRLLKADVVKNERMLMSFVVHEVFKDMKFTFGDEDEEMELCQISIRDKYVTIKDPKISESAFVSEYWTGISRNVTHLRTRAISAARKKFIRKYP